MFEPRLISPMLDNYAMGAPISEHDGIRCCPAMPKGTDQRYIVKIISIPASQTQLDALLLAGAYPNEEAALRYFASVADEIKEEVDILSKLAKNEGFIPFEDCQVVPMENGTGYEVYLLSPYKRSVARFLQKETMTHLKAINLGLDMCAALALCRQAGYLYVDLKPENIYVSGDGEFRIGDLGFLKLDSLKYASLPDKYRSCYTAPEVQDIYASLNASMDVYAAGLVLYQVYNGGTLPFEGAAPAKALPAPTFADYEMAEIILKACDPDPAQRWANPVLMGQALISYMQRNGANDVPIVPVAAPVNKSVADELPQAEPEAMIEVPSAQTQTLTDVTEEDIPAVAVSEVPAEELPEEIPAEELPEEIPAQDIPAAVSEQEAFQSESADVPSEEDTPAPETDLPAAQQEELPADEAPAEQEELPADDAPAEQEDSLPVFVQGGAEMPAAASEQEAVLPAAVQEDLSAQDAPAAAEAELPAFAAETEDEEASSDAAPQESAESQISMDDFIAQLMRSAEPSETELPNDADAVTAQVQAEPEPADATVALDVQLAEDAAAEAEPAKTEIPPELGDIIALADSLIADQPAKKEAPQEVVTNTAADALIREAFQKPAESSKEAATNAADNGNTPAETAQDKDNTVEIMLPQDEEDYAYEEGSSFNGKKLLAIILAAVLLIGLLIGGYIFYREYYLQSVTSLELEGNDNALTVHVKTSVDESLLSVVCVDTYGTKLVQPVVDGTATFTNLNPSTLYSIKVEISGLHKLHGEISDSYSTPMQSTIVSLNAVTGNESGSAIISFVVDGSDSDSWVLTYSADGEQEKTHSFSGHMATITGLTVGKDYKFVLTSAEGNYLTGETEILYTAIAPVFAEDLRVESNGSDGVNVSWQAPEDALVENWIVHCYDSAQYNQTVTVSETFIEFSGLDFSKACTIEVTAVGMSAGTRFYLSENTVGIFNESATVTSPDTIAVDWETAAAVSGQWVVQYSVEGLEDQQPMIVRTADTSATISPIIPNVTYQIEIKLENGSTVLAQPLSVTTPEAAPFQGHVLGYLVKDTPIQFNMCKRPAYDGWSYANVLAYTNAFSKDDLIGFACYIPGKYNPVNAQLSILFVYRDENGTIVQQESSIANWKNIWYQRRGELDAPTPPQTPGTYTVEIYFDGYLAHKQEFTVN